MEEYPKIEKVNDNVVRIISERIEEVYLSSLLETKKRLEEKLAQVTETLKNVNKIIQNAEKLGITPKPKDKNPQK